MKRGDFLLSWAFLTSLTVLLVNDFILKRAYHSPVTGLASDAAGVVFFPIATVAMIEFLAWLLPARPLARPWWFAAATVLIGAGFAMVKLTIWGEVAYEALVTPIDAAMGTGLGVQGLGVVRDPVDLLALLLVPVPIWVSWKWRGRRTQSPSGEGPDGFDAVAIR